MQQLLPEASGVLTSSYTTGNQWLLNDVVLDGQTGTTFTPVKTGSYKVRVTTDGCEVTSTGLDFVVKDPPVEPPPIETTTGLGDDKEFSVKFTPNPVSDKLTVIITGGDQVKDIRIANQLGQVVGRIPVRKSSSTTTGEFVMKDLPAGVYIIHVIGDNLVHTERIVKL
ncbi:MAG: T9SS type A sorting domain-containing protein [Bacteroidota bacterium]